MSLLSNYTSMLYNIDDPNLHTLHIFNYGVSNRSYNIRVWRVCMFVVISKFLNERSHYNAVSFV